MANLLPFISCAHPVLVNYRGFKMAVPCNHCVPCSNNKRSSLALKLHLEENKARYCYFLTLTYDNEHLPLYSIKSSCDKIEFMPLSDRLIWDLGNKDDNGDLPCEYVNFKGIDYHTLLASFDNYHRQIALYVRNHPTRDLPVYGFGVNKDKYALLYYRDSQLFVKRVRKYISKKYGEKIRYYIIGEYGTESLRPHWHCLFFFDSDSVAKDFETVCQVKCADDGKNECPLFLRTLWRYGTCTSQRTDKSAYSYVSSYVNKSASFPLFIDLVRSQKAFHSVFLGSVLSEKDIAAVYRTRDFQSFRVRCVANSDGSTATYSLWRTLYSKVFPRLPYVSLYTHEELFDLYTLYSYVSKYVCFVSVKDMAYYIYMYLDGTLDMDTFPIPWCVQHRFELLRRIYLTSCAHCDKPVDCFYRLLLVSKQFNDICNEYGITSFTLYHLIGDFYKFVDLSALGNHYLKAELDDSYAKVYYDSIVDLSKLHVSVYADSSSLRYINIPWFRSFYSQQVLKADKAIKHREKIAFINQFIS